jgi:hypothetical protein
MVLTPFSRQKTIRARANCVRRVPVTRGRELVDVVGGFLIELVPANRR